MLFLWSALGVVSLLAAIGLAWTVKEVKVGENVARLVGFILAFSGYWYVTALSLNSGSLASI
jgi:hypothetical protein